MDINLLKLKLGIFTALCLINSACSLIYNNTKSQDEFCFLCNKKLKVIKCIIDTDTINITDININFNKNQIENLKEEVIKFCSFEEKIKGQIYLSILLFDYTNEKKYPYPYINEISSISARSFFMRNDSCLHIDFNSNMKNLGFDYTKLNGTFLLDTTAGTFSLRKSNIVLIIEDL